MKQFYFDSNLFLKVQLTKISFGEGNGLAPNRRQAITCTKAGPFYRRIYAALGGDGVITWLTFYKHNYKPPLHKHLFINKAICSTTKTEWVCVTVVRISEDTLPLLQVMAWCYLGTIYLDHRRPCSAVSLSQKDFNKETFANITRFSDEWMCQYIVICPDNVMFSDRTQTFVNWIPRNKFHLFFKQQNETFHSTKCI